MLISCGIFFTECEAKGIGQILGMCRGAQIREQRIQPYVRGLHAVPEIGENSFQVCRLLTGQQLDNVRQAFQSSITTLIMQDLQGA